MKITNKIISLMLSVQVAATSVFAVPDSLQKRPNPASGGVTEPLDSKDEKNIDAKTIVKKIALFPPKALWWFVKNNLIMVGMSILDGIIIGPIKITIDYKRVPSEQNCRVLCEDMCCCLKKLGKSLEELSGLNISSEIEQEYQRLTDNFEIVEKFLSHYKISMYECYGILEQPVPTGAGNKMYYKEKFEMHRDNKSFKHAGNGLRTIVGKFYHQCSLIVYPDKHRFDGREKDAKETFQKLAEWKKTMDIILAK